jgi:PTS system cellobiose-specific IIB component
VASILVICAAGASSTFLVHRMRREASDRGLSVDVRAGTPLDLPTTAPGDVVLLGHHLAAEYPALREQADALGLRLALLPAMSSDADGARTALALAVHPTTDHDPT